MPPVARARPGTAGLLVMSATTAVLLVFGWRDGEPAKAFRNAGRMLLESGNTPGTALPLAATIVGLVHHVVVAVLWGALLLLIVRLFRGWARVVMSLAVATGFAMLNLLVIPPVLGVGYAVVTSLGRAVPLALSIALALLVTPWASRVPDQYPSTSPTY
jgi:hypothetical protein